MARSLFNICCEQNSPVHDHSGSHCIMKVLEGELLETHYKCPQTSKETGGYNHGIQWNSETPLKVKSKFLLHQNEVTYIHGKQPKSAGAIGKP